MALRAVPQDLPDAPLEACRQWITGWRCRVGEGGGQPPLTFAAHLGVEAAAESRVRLPTELYRRYALAGFEGKCVCGRAAT